jgi:hypothetical protein
VLLVIEYALSLRERAGGPRLFGVLSAPEEGDVWMKREVRGSCEFGREWAGVIGAW